MNWLAVFIGGGLGSLCRYGLSTWCASWYSQFPLGTLVSNFDASAVLGVAAWLMADKVLQPGSFTAMFLTIGFCGGFSTFSTFSLETLQLIRNGQFPLALLNILISISACILVLWIILRKS
jgi:CrcB protein